MKGVKLAVVVGLIVVFSAALASAETSLGTAIRSLANPYHADWAEAQFEVKGQAPSL